MMNKRKQIMSAVRLFHWRVGGILVLFLLVLLTPACQENEPNSSGDELNLRAPVGLSVAFLSATTAEVEWIDPNDYSTINRRDVRYEVQMSTDSLRFQRVGTTASDSTRTIITHGFADDSTYHFRVRILAPEVSSPFSIVRSLSPLPHARIDLSVTAVSETTVTLEWSVAGSPVVRTIIEQKVGTGGTFTPVGSVDGPDLSTNVRGPYHVDTAYYFRVQTISDLDVRSHSDTAVAVLFFNAPSNLQASFLADTAVGLSWILDNPHAGRVVLEGRYRVGASFQLALSDTVSAGQPSCILPGRFLASQQYYFRAYALSSYNRSTYSGTIGAGFFFHAPAELRVRALSSSSIEFAWDDMTSFETSFELMQSVNDSASTTVGTFPADAVGGELSIQSDWDFTYRYRIRARSTYNLSTPSNGVLVLFDQSLGVWTWYSVP